LKASFAAMLARYYNLEGGRSQEPEAQKEASG
jgi:hypothetical protein